MITRLAKALSCVLDRFAAAAAHAFSHGASAAALVHQHIIGTKEFAK